ncbi:MAG: branched-chain amino acid ABC transporter permease [Phycisphaerae bacterium]|nr:branched-chain amino acid ABC transporter permease [Phycisphaerae bacterium]
MQTFFETLINGLAVGSLYALVALGYTMVYGILKFINFAHSDIVVLGAWIAFVLARSLGYATPDAAAPWYAGLLILLVAMTACGAIGYAVERLAYKPLRGAPRLNVLITAIGVSLFLQNTGQLSFLFGASPQRMPSLLPDTPLLTVFGARVSLVDVVGAGTAVLLMVGLEYLIFHTKLGRAMRAVSYNTSVASLMGVNVNAVISFTFVVGSALAAAAGFLYSMKYVGIKQPADAGWVMLGLKAFVAAVVGGIGNIRGAMIGGVMIGLLEFFGAAYVSTQYRDVYVFALLILVLLFRPAGLFGRATVEKV